LPCSSLAPSDTKDRVGQGIQPADENRSHRTQAGDIVMRRHTFLQAGYIGFSTLPVLLSAEYESYIDINTIGK